MNNWKSIIQHVIDKRINIYKAQYDTMFLLDAAEKFMNELGYKRIYFDTNGWEYDYWLIFSNGEKYFMLSGNPWHGKQTFYELFGEELEGYQEYF